MLVKKSELNDGLKDHVAVEEELVVEKGPLNLFYNISRNLLLLLAPLANEVHGNGDT